MKESCSATIVSASAVIGAGFVSGKEIVSFFTHYGIHSFWLILLCVITMCFLSAICLRCHGAESVMRVSAVNNPLHKKASSLFFLLILFVFAGSMLSAAGHMILLVFPFPFAYAAGLAGTLCIAFLLSRRGGKGFFSISLLITVVFIFVLFLSLRLRNTQPLPTGGAAKPQRLIKAAVYAVGYGAMNIMLAKGVIMQSASAPCREKDRQAVYLGFLLGFLMLLSNLVYMGKEKVFAAEFPIVSFFSSYGVYGYFACAVLMYFAILTSLIAILLSIKMQFCMLHTPDKTAFWLTMLLTILISCIGFTRIVEMLYAPLGLCCLPFFACMAKEYRKKRLDNAEGKF